MPRNYVAKRPWSMRRRQVTFSHSVYKNAAKTAVLRVNIGGTIIGDMHWWDVKGVSVKWIRGTRVSGNLSPPPAKLIIKPSFVRDFTLVRTSAGSLARILALVDVPEYITATDFDITVMRHEIVHEAGIRELHIHVPRKYVHLSLEKRKEMAEQQPRQVSV